MREIGGTMKGRLTAFEQRVKDAYDRGEIKAPVHLSGGNEDQLVEIFKIISPRDWVLSGWRNHYHALLHGMPEEELFGQILRGRSMYVNSPEYRFYASSIAGGICPIAVGIGMAIKRKKENRKVFCFVGDMTARTGIFRECREYAENFGLPVRFVVEDNGKSVATPTAVVWGAEMPRIERGNTTYYRYELTWPHHGTGNAASF